MAVTKGRAVDSNSIAVCVDRLDVVGSSKLKALVSFDDAVFGLRLVSTRLAGKADVMMRKGVVLFVAYSWEELAATSVASQVLAYDSRYCLCSTFRSYGDDGVFRADSCETDHRHGLPTDLCSERSFCQNHPNKSPKNLPLLVRLK